MGQRDGQKGGIMTSGQIDKLCMDWLRENYNEETASEFRSYSLIIRVWDTPELNDALDTLRQVLCMSFDPSESFGSTDYHKARMKLGLPEDKVPIPEAFIKAFAGT